MKELIIAIIKKRIATLTKLGVEYCEIKRDAKTDKDYALARDLEFTVDYMKKEAETILASVSILQEHGPTNDALKQAFAKFSTEREFYPGHYSRDMKEAQFIEAVRSFYATPTSKENKYYIQNKDAGYLGNSIIFWAKNSRGYTAYLNNCEQFTEEEARRICLGNPDKNKAWPVEYIDNNNGTQRVTDSQYLHTTAIKDFNEEK